MKIYKWNPNQIELQNRLSPGRGFLFAERRNIEQKIETIYKDIAMGGDEKLFEYTQEFENHVLDSKTIKVSRQEMDIAWQSVPEQDRKTILFAKKRIENFHKKQLPRQFTIREKSGAVLQQRVVPLERVGIYIPAGRAPLFSTVLMTAIPAKIAGVKEIVMISPWPSGQMNPYILVAAQLVGVDEIYKVGGVQGIVALAHGTRSIRRVNKIVGPGSVWVSEAKAFVARMGKVGIDTLAGPSEVVILVDGYCPARWVAADLLSQLEHGEDSRAVLITPKQDYAEQVRREFEALVKSSERKKYLHGSIKHFATAIWTDDLEQAIGVVNKLSPEHLEIMAQHPRNILKKIANAASIFIGPFSPVAIGDYLAGPNHVLPTYQQARFASPLGVEDFVKRQSVVEFSREALEKLGPVAMRMAELEGLDAHAKAIEIRLKKKPARKKS